MPFTMTFCGMPFDCPAPCPNFRAVPAKIDGKKQLVRLCKSDNFCSLQKEGSISEEIPAEPEIPEEKETIISKA